MAVEVKLWRFSLPNMKDVLYLYSLRNDEAYLRRMFRDQDQGDMNWEDYKLLYSEGRIERITSLDQVPRDETNPAALYRGGDQDCYPYHSWELADNEFELTIEQFFNLPVEYK